jgi:hypothetical protein
MGGIVSAFAPRISGFLFVNGELMGKKLVFFKPCFIYLQTDL